jgi:hypothetical protein
LSCSFKEFLHLINEIFLRQRGGWVLKELLEQQGKIAYNPKKKKKEKTLLEQDGTATVMSSATIPST